MGLSAWEASLGVTWVTESPTAQPGGHVSSSQLDQRRTLLVQVWGCGLGTGDRCELGPWFPAETFTLRYPVMPWGAY